MTFLVDVRHLHPASSAILLRSRFRHRCRTITRGAITGMSTISCSARGPSGPARSRVSNPSEHLSTPSLRCCSTWRSGVRCPAASWTTAFSPPPCSWTTSGARKRLTTRREVTSINSTAHLSSRASQQRQRGTTQRSATQRSSYCGHHLSFDWNFALGWVGGERAVRNSANGSVAVRKASMYPVVLSAPTRV